MKTSIVTTTIHIPHALERCARNAKDYGHKEVEFIVAGDRKSPAGTREFCDGLAARYYPCEYLDIEDQRRYLDRFPDLWNHLRFDSIQRRNIALLRAYENGAGVVITIDDDNWTLNQDLVGLHGLAGAARELPCLESTSGWFNVCSVLEEENGTPFYHRGFPVSMRWRESEAFQSVARRRVRVAVNAGFWLDDPDIDALSRIHRQIVVKGFKTGTPPTLALEPGTWCPFNSQNTALLREVIPAYFLSPYVGRYDDIWSSYVVTRIAERLGDVIAFGEPLMRQKRNEHDLWKDLDAERIGTILTPGYCAALREARLQGASYHECLGEIIEAMSRNWEPEARWTEAMVETRDRVLEGWRIWHAVFERIASGK